MSKTILKIDRLSKIFGKKGVLEDISFEIKDGEIFGIIGMSGSGKSTLLKTMIGFYAPEAGDVLFRHNVKDDFQKISKDYNDIKMFVGFAPQTPSFYPKLTAFENLDHFGALYGLPKSVRHSNIKYLLKLTNLEDASDRLAEQMSGGMQKRLGIACALVHKPKILILDEPTADLDPILRTQTWHLIKKINEQGTAVILASHFLTELESLCSRIGVLYKGKIKEIGTSNQLKKHYSTNEEITFESSPGKYQSIINALKKEGLPIQKTINKGHKAVIYTPKAEVVLHRLLHILEVKKEKLLDVEVNKPSLREVFESLTKRKK